MKKIILATSAVLLLTAGGGYYYCAQQFENNAKILVAAIEKAKPTLSFDSIEIDKYRFQMRFKSFTLDTSSAQAAGGVGAENVPIRMAAPYSMVLYYNPITKTVTVIVPEQEFPIHLVQGKIDRQMNYTAEGPVELKMSFKSHPVLKDFELQKFIHNLKEFSVHRPRTAMLDVQSGQSLVSLDSAQINLRVNFPENDQEDADLNLNYQITNLFVDKDLFKTLQKMVEAALPEEKAKEVARSIFSQIANWTYNTTEKGEFDLKMKMETLTQLMRGDVDFRKGIPALNGAFKSDHVSRMGGLKGGFDLNSDSKLIKMKFNVMGKYGPEARVLFGSHLADIMNEFAKNPRLTDAATGIPSLSEKIVLDITPDLASLGNVKVSLDLDANLEKSEGKFDFSLATDPYGVTAKGNYGMLIGGKIEAEFTNYEKFLADLKVYIDRVFSHQEIKSALPADAQEKTMQSLMIGQMTLEAMGKKEQKDGKMVLKIEQALPGLGQMPVMPGVPAAESAVPKVLTPAPELAVPSPSQEPAK